ncbi:hypothetical protein EI94DRAFT_1699988 [Lactarius quietus]|nr:hypothetical protein EI94DRAFT_1699988 [Lactarius quietus]
MREPERPRWSPGRGGRGSGRILLKRRDSDVVLWAARREIDVEFKFELQDCGGTVAACRDADPSSVFAELAGHEQDIFRYQLRLINGAGGVIFRATFSASETSVIYTTEANEPENNVNDLFSNFRFLPDYSRRYLGRKHVNTQRSSSRDGHKMQRTTAKL